MPTSALRVLAVAALIAVTVGCGSDDDPQIPAGSASGATAVTATTPATSAAATSVAGAATPSDTPSAAATSSSAPAPAPPTESSSAPASPAAASGGGSPCDLLSAAEVAKAIGAQQVKAELTDHGPPLGAKQCVWSNDTVPVRTYSLSVQRTADMAQTLRDAGQTATSLYENSKPIYTDGVPIAGIGDDAVISKSTIIARKGDVFIQASTFFGTSADAIAALKALTTQAIAKI